MANYINSAVFNHGNKSFEVAPLCNIMVKYLAWTNKNKSYGFGIGFDSPHWVLNVEFNHFIVSRGIENAHTIMNFDNTSVIYKVMNFAIRKAIKFAIKNNIPSFVKEELANVMAHACWPKSVRERVGQGNITRITYGF